ncbi:MAG TPA: hypothetical protein VHG30_03630 [Microvirga sp.]|nr:hypothetical protein [Microvirga sp.]
MHQCGSTKIEVERASNAVCPSATVAFTPERRGATSDATYNDRHLEELLRLPVELKSDSCGWRSDGMLLRKRSPVPVRKLTAQKLHGGDHVGWEYTGKDDPGALMPANHPSHHEGRKRAHSL